MIRAIALAALLSTSLAPAYALNHAGVELAPLIRVPDQSRPWPLSGSALIHRSFIPFYGLALYAPLGAVNGAEDISLGLTPLQITLVWYANSLPKAQVQEHFRKQFEQVADADTMARISSRLDKFLAVLPDAERGKRITIHYSPDGGARIEVEGGGDAHIPGIEFNRALISIWLGPKADGEVRKNLTTPPTS
jgi:hypothetical protein